MRIVEPGRLSYEEGLKLQLEHVAEASKDPTGESLILLEHEPVFTIGRTLDQSSLRDPSTLPFPVVQTNRGGQATYHGPGQLVGYAILNLNYRRRDLHALLRAMEEAIIRVCAHFNIESGRKEGLTGVWVGPRKIASIGIGVRHWVSMHGFALNVQGDLSPFSEITPCGIQDVQMTSLSLESGREVSMEEAMAVVGKLTRETLDEFLPSSLPARNSSPVDNGASPSQAAAEGHE